MCKIISTLFLLTLLSCSFTEPSSLIIKNNSDYTIDVDIKNTVKKNISIGRKKGEDIYLYPGDIEFSIEVGELYMKKDYFMHISYLEKKKFEFYIE